MSTEKVFDLKQIKETLPHRYPFLLVDRIVEFEENQRIVGLKNVTANEPFFTGHFPDNEVMPGVLILEALAQTGAMLCGRSSDGNSPDELLMLTGINDCKFKRPVQPGDTLMLEMVVDRYRKPLYVMNGSAYVDGQLVAGAKISAAITPKPAA